MGILPVDVVSRPPNRLSVAYFAVDGRAPSRMIRGRMSSVVVLMEFRRSDDVEQEMEYQVDDDKRHHDAGDVPRTQDLPLLIARIS
jgi:hypothetical protein